MSCPTSAVATCTLQAHAAAASSTLAHYVPHSVARPGQVHPAGTRRARPPASLWCDTPTCAGSVTFSMK